MNSSDEKWIVIACNSSFIITDIIAIKNIVINIAINDKVSKIVQHNGIHKFVDFTLALRNQKVSFGDELGVVDVNNSVTFMDFCGLEYNAGYIITFFTNYLGLYDELLKINDDPINILRLKMKHYSVSPGSYQELAVLNNDVINIQRDLYKKNSIIQDLMNKKEETNKELEVLNSTKDRIFSIIGHDLRAPLANIIQSMNLIASDKLIYEEWKQENFFDTISDSAANSMHLLENLLDWSKIQLGESSFFPKDFNLLQSIRPTIALLKGVAAKKRISIVEKLSSNPYVYADKRMIEVILRNLVSNSIKFTNEDGHITIKVSVDKGFAKIVIIDNGIGMSREKMETLFDLTKNNVAYGTKGETGTGFGLVLCKNLTQQNGGSISIWSEIEKGSEFTFTIPLSNTQVKTFPAV